MRKVTIVLALFIFSMMLQAEEVILQTGEKIKCDTIECKDGFVIIDGKRKVALEDVKILNAYKVRKIVQNDNSPKVEDKEIKKILKLAAKAKAKYPDVKGIMLRDHGHSQKDKDGSFRYWYHFIGIVMSDDTRNWADMRLGFDESSSSVDLVMARSISPDGKVSNLDKNKMKEIQPKMERLSYFTANQRYKIKVGTIPNVKIGSIVEYIYTSHYFEIEDKNKMPFNSIIISWSYIP